MLPSEERRTTGCTLLVESVWLPLVLKALPKPAAVSVYVPRVGVHAEAAADGRLGSKLVSEAKSRHPVVPHALLQAGPAIGVRDGVPHRAGSVGGGIDDVRIEPPLIPMYLGPSGVALPPQAQVQRELRDSL